VDAPLHVVNAGAGAFKDICPQHTGVVARIGGDEFGA
jgi:hypothetical protein